MKPILRMASAIFLAIGVAFILSAPAFAQTTPPGCSFDTPGVAPVPGTAPQASPRDAFTTAYNYLVAFYPRWTTYLQGTKPPCNQLLSSDQMTPDYLAVVAINDDTLYTSVWISVKTEPVIVTVPETTDIYSVLHLDLYGNVIPNSIPSGIPGTYALTGPDWKGTPALPQDATHISLPDNYTILLLRADLFSPTGVDMGVQASDFRNGLLAAPLSVYLSNPKAGGVVIRSVTDFKVSFKLIADNLIATDPIQFLASLQAAVLAGTTPPLAPAEQSLSDAFNTLFADQSLYPQLINGTRAGFADIVSDYLTHTIKGSTWINFTNIGEWDKSFQGYLDRSAITEYLQLGNNHNAAAYYHTFLDGHGAPLDGHTPGYVLKFAKGQQPDARRFWSVTAYTPDTVELVPNAANKYLVARYTPGLVTAADGSVTILVSTECPAGFPVANWLPIPQGRFNIMLRVYGPEGSVLDNSYIPPPIERLTPNQLR